MQRDTTSVEDIWDDVVRSLRRLERTPLRRAVRRTLQRVSPHLVGADPLSVQLDPLRGWQRFVHSVTHDKVEPLDEFLRARIPDLVPIGSGQELTWHERASSSVDILLSHLPSEHDDLDLLGAIVLAHCYLDCIVIWEHTTDIDPLKLALQVVADRSESWAVSLPSGLQPRPSHAVLLRAIATAARALVLEFDVEVGWSSSSPTRVMFAAEAACSLLAQAHQLIADDTSPVPPASTPELVGAAEAIRTAVSESIHDPLNYFSLLAEEVGPAAQEFVENLSDRKNDPSVIRRLRQAAEATSEIGEQLFGIMRTENRAQLRSINGMIEALTGPEDVRSPSLVVDGGEIHYLYPFGLPSIAAAQGDVIQALLHRHLQGDPDPQVPRRPRLAGCRVTIDEALQTKVSTGASELVEGGQAAARVVFPDDRLILETGSGDRLVGLEVEVLLNTYGNHLVRFSVSTTDPVEHCDQGPLHLADGCGGSFSASRSSWTPHELDCFLHRGGLDFGAERIYFAPVGEPLPHHPTELLRASDGHPLPETDRGTEGPWTSLIHLAATIVVDLHRVVARLNGSTVVAPAGGSKELESGGRQSQPDPVSYTAHLRRQAHVVTLVTECHSVLDGERTPINTPSQLASCSGSVTVLSSQPPAPRALEEWTCAAPLSTDRLAGNAGLLGSLDGQVLCNGDATLIFAPAAPNWQLLEDRELVMLAVSLGSAYTLARRRLLEEIESATALDIADDLASQPREQLRAIAERVRSTEQQLAEWVAYSDSLLEHALGAAVVRPRRDRALLDHIIEHSGVFDLQQALLSSRSVAVDRLDSLRDVAGQIAEAERRRGQDWVERFLMAVAVLAFIDLFWLYFDIERDVDGWGWRLYFAGVVAFLIGAAAVVFLMVFGRSLKLRR